VLTTYQRNMFFLPKLKDEIDELAGDQVRKSEERAGHDHEPEDDPRGLDDLALIRPLYPLQLAPAALGEADQAVATAGSGLAGLGVAVAPVITVVTAVTAAVTPRIAPAARAAVVELLIGEELVLRLVLRMGGGDPERLGIVDGRLVATSGDAGHGVLSARA
jgi:hypothetical protein